MHIPLPSRVALALTCALALSPAIAAAQNRTNVAAATPPADAIPVTEHSGTLKRVRDTATLTIGVREPMRSSTS